MSDKSTSDPDLALLIASYPEYDSDVLSSLFYCNDCDVGIVLSLLGLDSLVLSNRDSVRGPSRGLKDIMDEQLAWDLAHGDGMADRQGNEALFPVKEEECKVQQGVFAEKVKKNKGYLKREHEWEMEKLESMFPSQPKHLLRELFELSGFRFENAILWIKEMTGLKDEEIPSVIESKEKKLDEASELSCCVESLDQLIDSMLARNPIVLPRCIGFADFREMAEHYAKKMIRQDNAAILVQETANRVQSIQEKAAICIFYQQYEFLYSSYEFRNRNLSIISECDLHFLHVTEAVRCLKAIFARVNGRRIYSVVTGRGSHSHIM